MDAGRVAEAGAPAALLDKSDGPFAAMTDAVDEKALAAGFLDLEQEMGIAIDYVKHDDAKAMAA